MPRRFGPRSGDTHQQIAEIADSLREVERGAVPVPPNSDVSVSVFPGESIRLQPTAVGQELVFPGADPDNSGQLIQVYVLNPLGTVTFRPLAGTINGSPSATKSTGGAAILRSDGISDWMVEGGVAGTGGALDAEYVVGAMHPDLTQERLATTTETVIFDRSTAGIARWHVDVHKLAAYARSRRWGDGEDGRLGRIGQTGAAGRDGRDGQSGRDGDDGGRGRSGTQGIDGKDGRDGSRGRIGDEGDRGRPGRDGKDGATGATGATGADGSGGGSSGRNGRAGDDGGRGPIGPRALDGRDGRDGTAGRRGYDGDDARRPLQTIITNTNTTVGGVGFISTATVNLGSVALWSGEFDVTGLAGLTADTPVLAGRAMTAASPDETQEQMVISGKVLNSTTIRFEWEGVNGPVSGSVLIQFCVASSAGAFVGTGANFYQLGREDSDMTGTVGQLTVVPMFNWSRDAVAHVAEFNGGLNQQPFEGFCPGGRMQVHKIPSEANHPGILRCIVPLGQIGWLRMGNAQNEALWDPATVLGFRCIIRCNTANPGADYDLHIGFLDDVPIVNKGIGWTTNSGGLWTAFAVDAGSTTDTDDAIVVGNWFVLEMVRQSGVTWLGYINGVANNQAIATDVPTALLNFGIRLADDGGGSVDFSIDVDALTVFTGPLGQRWT